MPPSDPPVPLGTERRAPTVKDFPARGPFSLAAPAQRFGARALDLAVIAAPALIVLAFTSQIVDGQLQLEAPSWLGPAVICLGVLYEFVSVALAGREIGKWLFGLKVVRFIDGGRPRPAQAFLRALVPWSMLALPLGPFAFGLFVLVYGSGIGGALHRGVPDQAGGTLVISTR